MRLDSGSRQGRFRVAERRIKRVCDIQKLDGDLLGAVVRLQSLRDLRRLQKPAFGFFLSVERPPRSCRGTVSHCPLRGFGCRTCSPERLLDASLLIALQPAGRVATVTGVLERSAQEKPLNDALRSERRVHHHAPFVPYGVESRSGNVRLMTVVDSSRDRCRHRARRW